MAVGIIVHVSAGKEKRTEFFGEEMIRVGSDETSELQIHTKKIKFKGLWFELELSDGVYRIINFNEKLNIKYNDEDIRRFTAIEDGDTLSIESANILFSFFSLTSESSLITTNREPHIVQFIEEAAVGAATTEKRDDAKAFLREFSRELLREISWTTKLTGLVLAVGLMSGIFYLGYASYLATVEDRMLAEQQNIRIKQLQDQIAKTNSQIGELDKSNKIVQGIVSLAANLNSDYGKGICLIVGVYDLVDRKSGKILRYPDPKAFEQDPYEETPPPTEEGLFEMPEPQGLTTIGNGDPVEYDFIGTGFHVGNGYIVTNRHVLQPWTEDDLVKQLMKDSKGRARVKKLVIYFPNHTKAYTLIVRKVSYKEDLAIASITNKEILSEIPVLPLEINDSTPLAIGKTVVTMGYPSGPDRLMAMLEDDEAREFNRKYGNSRQNLINFLAQSQKIVPLTTQGTITDLDNRRVVHDAKTAEGGSGAPLFGQSGKVIGVNFGVFTQNTATNMAVQIKFAIKLLEQVGWTEEDNTRIKKLQPAQTAQNTTATTKNNSQ